MPPKHLHEEQHRGLVPQDQLGTGSDGSGDHFLADDQTYKLLPSSIADLQGYAWKLPVYAATTIDGSLAVSFDDGEVIDGITLATGMRILIKDQLAPEENGIYIVQASGAPTRATDADSGAELVAAAVSVALGTANINTSWACTAPATPTLDTDPLPWVELRTLNDSSFPLITAFGLFIRPPTWGGANGEGVAIQGNDATGSGSGGTVAIYGGGDPTDAFVGADFEATGADPTGHGKAALLTGGTYGDEGQVLMADASGYAVWADIDGGGP